MFKNILDYIQPINDLILSEENVQVQKHVFYLHIMIQQ